MHVKTIVNSHSKIDVCTIVIRRRDYLMLLPDTYTEKNETGCCAIPNIEDWNEKIIEFNQKRFIREYTKSVFYVPTNMDKVMRSLSETATKAQALMPAEESMILSRDISPFKAEQLYAVSKEVPRADNVVLSGSFATKVFEGDYKNAKSWHEDLSKFVETLGKRSSESYFFYTTCPACAQHYGKNYTIGLARLSN